MIYIHAVAVVSASEFRMEEYTRAIPLITLCTTEVWLQGDTVGRGICSKATQISTEGRTGLTSGRKRWIRLSAEQKEDEYVPNVREESLAGRRKPACADTPHPCTIRPLDVADRHLQIVQLLLQLRVLLGHLLVLLLPLVAGRLQGLHLALVVAGLDVGLAEPVPLARAL